MKQAFAGCDGVISALGDHRKERPKTRMEAARDQLTRLVEQLPSESKANFVFFSTDIEVWADELTLLDEDDVAGAYWVLMP